ncbi:MAG: NAD(P)/FAD-dependent oxidoreductase [Thermodesulfovibrionales bacterium]
METAMHKDVIVIGAGASGMLCAIEAGNRGRSVLIVEHGQHPGRKISASGGGRCNATNLFAAEDRYYSANRHFCRSALARYTPQHFLELGRRNGLRFVEEEDGKIFCRDGSRAVVAMLRKECSRAGAVLAAGCRVMQVEKDASFRVKTDKGTFASSSLVVATGGLSCRSLGASDLGYRIARSFGLRVTDLKPGLVPFTFGQSELRDFGRLSGVSVGVSVRCGGKEFRGPLLFTHRGLSGPVALQASNCWIPGQPLRISLVPELDAHGFLLSNRRRKIELRTLLSTVFPRSLAEVWCSRTGSKPINQYSEKDLRSIAEGLSRWEFVPAGTEGYERAEVTMGGIDTDGVSSKTMEARDVAGLYFIGEVLDVTGQLGGFNLHWAWASGYAAGQHA